MSELSQSLVPEDDGSLAGGLDTSVAHPARVYDHLLGGKDNISQVVPVTPVSASLVSV
jgi:hypothetical protein